MGSFTLGPKVPSVNTHDKIIDLNAHITIELVLKGNTDVNDDTDDSCWIHPNLFFFGIPDAY